MEFLWLLKWSSKDWLGHVYNYKFMQYLMLNNTLTHLTLRSRVGARYLYLYLYLGTDFAVPVPVPVPASREQEVHCTCTCTCR